MGVTTMKGSIRAGIGFLVVYAAVGGMDNASDTQLFSILLPSLLKSVTSTCSIFIFFFS